MTFEQAKKQVSVFRSEQLAWSAADHRKAGVVVLGDAGEYWVCTMRVAAVLERLGYEWARR